MARPRYLVTVDHTETPPGSRLIFWLKIRKYGDPAQCTRLVPLGTGEMVELVRSIELASASAKAQRARDAMMTDAVAGNA